MKLSLGSKISLLVAVPLLAFLLFSFISLKQRWNHQLDAVQIEKNIHLFLGASRLIHEIQRERGKSVLYISNPNIGFNELKNFREKTDQEVSTLKEALRHGSHQSGEAELIESVFVLIEQTRKLIDQRDHLDESKKGLTIAISKLMEEQARLVQRSSLQETQSYLSSVTQLEFAKENLGQLRAVVSGVLTKNQAMLPEQVALVGALEFGVRSTLSSNSLRFSIHGMKEVADFSSSMNWKKVKATLQNVIEQSPKGGFSETPDEFFKTISTSIDDLAYSIRQELEFVDQYIENIKAKARKEFWGLFVTVILLSGSLVFFSYRFVKSISKRLESIASTLSNGGAEVAQASHLVSKSSDELTEGTTRQGEALTETVASLDQIRAMVQKNAEAAENSRDHAMSSRKTTEKAQVVIQEMIKAIEEIQQSNELLFKEVEAGNQGIRSIEVIISEIGNKTKVIHDIVFQTKLLSFNASVEAAKAGEHGKGFSVVAEEVGSLAAMSGKAAQEIAAIVEKSTQAVQDLVQSTNQKVQAAIQVGQVKVSNGIDSAKTCHTVLGEIHGTVAQVTDLVLEISTATKEQAQGVSEISKAMLALDKTTKKNSAMALESSSIASQLAKQTDLLKNAVGLLVSTVQGGRV